ncbi:hypothetical protein CVT24_007480 [Panaeolus cyanescens]|uniref:Fungal-type protein kinase domain-containing protein n=1 Tax=Panaeolus cyanescens TaxID=181874 RepID=A0A409YL87_9AGAR|nr:hypothetical protein CVT24_007480 [Panaeolus cyanescens]
MTRLYSDDTLRHCNFRTIEQFDDPREILSALRDAVIDNREKWLATQQVHGNIDSTSILISDSGVHGYLIDPLRPSDGTFASARALDRARRRSLFSRHYDRGFDYIEDLESFYHVLGWICSVFEGPHQYKVELPGLLKHFLQPTRVIRIALRRELIMQNGYESCPLSPYFSEDNVAFPELLRRMQAVLKTGYERDERRSRLLKPSQKRKQAEQDYSVFIEAIDDALHSYNLGNASDSGSDVAADKEIEALQSEELTEQAIEEWFASPLGGGLWDSESSSDSDGSGSSYPSTPAGSTIIPLSTKLDLPHPLIFGATQYPATSLQLTVDEDTGLEYAHLPSPSIFDFTLSNNNSTS